MVPVFLRHSALSLYPFDIARASGSQFTIFPLYSTFVDLSRACPRENGGRRVIYPLRQVPRSHNGLGRILLKSLANGGRDGT
jgi:hypothetical protein